MAAARLIIDSPQPGDWNMAVDEALLHSAAEGLMTVRFYEWSQPTLSLGYFQAYGDRQSHVSSLPCPCVRRSSGGGAILHDRELTYCFATPLTGRRTASPSSVYAAFHRSLILALSNWGVNARLCEGPSDGPLVPSTLPFLCFQRRSRGDVLLEEWKICGSAQRRHRGALLQHGSVILETSGNAPEIQGVNAVAGRSITPAALIAAWTDHLAGALEVCWEPGELASNEREAAEILRLQKFGMRDWTTRR